MTGLDTSADCILEIATIVTNKQLDVLAEGPVFAIHQPDVVLAGMDAWNTRTHTQSGLVARVRASRVDEFLAGHVPAGASPMCGNSICQDRRFLSRVMPALERYFHYRNLDVSTLKELARRWMPDVAARFDKESPHVALEDIRESIRELRYYRENLFRAPG
jgi:oligoribonuclease